MKKLLALIIILSALLSVQVFAEDTEDNLYTKIHFNSLGIADYNTIDSAEELEAAVEQIRKTGSVFGIKVHFFSFVYTPGSYPNLFKNLPYTELNHNDYAPNVYIKVKAEDITAAALEGLIKNDMIVSIVSDSRTIPDFVRDNGSFSFTDIKKSAWYYEHVNNAISMGLMEGTSATTFAPNATLTRAMLVTMIGRFEERLNGTLGEPGENTFSDVKAGKWYTDYVIWAAENEIVNGYPDGTFRPNAPVTREEVLTILGRYYEKNAPETIWANSIMQCYYPYTDTAEISDWASEWVIKAMRLGAVHYEAASYGASPDSAPEYYFEPDRHMTRAEVAKVAYVLLSNLEKSIERGCQSYDFDAFNPIK